MKKTFIMIFCLAINAVASVDKVSEILKNSKLVSDAKIGQLRQLLKTEQNNDRLVIETALAKLLFEAERYQEVIELPDLRAGLLVEYLWYFRGLSHAKMGQWKLSKKFLEKVKSAPANRRLKYLARLELAAVHAKRRHWRSAKKELRFLERRMRDQSEYPEVLSQLTYVELSSRHSWRACRWAKKLYRKFPDKTDQLGWGTSLKSAVHLGKRLGCRASAKDIKGRLRRWQLKGMDENYQKERDLFLATLPEGYPRDSVEVEFLLREGKPQKAVELMSNHHQEQKENFKFLLLLGRSAAKAENTPLSTYAYLKAYAKNPHWKKGRQALFKAAVTNYQFNNYDLSAQLFEQVIKKHSRSYEGRQAEWYLGWSDYLRGNYQATIDRFERIVERIESRRRGWRNADRDRFKYWMAMSYMKLKKLDEAREIFNSVGQQGIRSYYYLAAEQRLGELGGKMAHRAEEYALTQRFTASLVPAEEEHENVEESDIERTTVVIEDDDEDTDDADEIDEEVQVQAFRSERFKNFVRKATLLDEFGWLEYAKWELYEVERNTSNKEHLQVLIDLYTKLEFFNRAAYISQVYFSTDRGRYGVSGVRHLWEAAYPQAYSPLVTESSKKFLVPPPLVWSIMRAETIYRPNAVSPVGALGLMQVMPYTGNNLANLAKDESFVPEQLLQPKHAVHWGTMYLSRLSRIMKGDFVAIAGSYNAGPHRMKSWLKSFGELQVDEFVEHIPFRETRNYVKRVLRNYQVYQDLYGYEEFPKVAFTRAINAEWSGEVPRTEQWQ